MSGKHYKAIVGFDGYIDRIQRVVRSRSADGCKTYFDSIAEFSDRVRAAAGLSADLETEIRTVKLGGNAPIMAEAMSRLGVDTVCVGAMGYPDIMPEFIPLSEKCECLSVCDPAVTEALEFSDGKLMFADIGVLDRGMVWENIKEKIGVDTLRRILSESDLAAVVNWSGISGMNGIMCGMIRDILPYLPGRRRKFLFDLSDPSKRSDDEIRNVLETISGFSEFGETILGLNQNEAERVSAAVSGRRPASPEEAAETIFSAARVLAVVVHPLDRSVAVSRDGIASEKGEFVKKPVISTGGGDNFNAGFCLGWLSGMPMSDSLKLGMKVSGYYVRNGFSPIADIEYNI